VAISATMVGNLFADHPARQPGGSRSRARNTLAACHLPPFAVGTPRAISSAAIWRADRPAHRSSFRTSAIRRARHVGTGVTSAAVRH
jgi:hypothetical protein